MATYTGVSPTVTFTTTGTRTVVLTVTDSIGRTSTQTKTIPVTAGAAPPIAPTATLQTIINTNSIGLTWTLIADATATGIRVYRKSGTGSYAQLTTSNLTTATTSYTDTTAVRGTTYTYSIRYVNAAGAESVDSNEATGLLPSVTPPLADLRVTFTNNPEPAVISSAGLYTISGGMARFNLSSTVSASEFRIEPQIVQNAKIIAGGTLASISNGTGEYTDALSMIVGSDANGNRAVIRKHIKTDQVAPATPYDKIECRIVLNDVDTAPQVFDVTWANVKALALGFLPDGVTVVFMYSTNWTAALAESSVVWTELTRRAFPAANSFTDVPCTPVRRLDRFSGTATFTESTTDILYGSSNPFAAAPAGGTTAPAIRGTVTTEEHAASTNPRALTSLPGNTGDAMIVTILSNIGDAANPQGFGANLNAGSMSGWTLLRTASGGDLTTWTYGKIKVASEPMPSYSTTEPTAVTAVMKVAYSDVDTTTPFETTSVLWTSVSGQVWNSATVTPNGLHRTLVSIIGIDGGSRTAPNFTTPSGMTSRLNFLGRGPTDTPAGSDLRMGVADQEIGAAATPTWQGTEGDTAIVTNVVLKPSVSDPGGGGGSPGASVGDPVNLMIVPDSVMASEGVADGTWEASLTWAASVSSDAQPITYSMYYSLTSDVGSTNYNWVFAKNVTANGTIASPQTVSGLPAGEEIFLSVVASTPTATSSRSNVVGIVTGYVPTWHVVSLPDYIESNTQTANYTLQLEDHGTSIDMNSTTAKTVTVPPEVDVPFKVGAVIDIMQVGSGVVSVVPGTGVTIVSRGNFLKTNGVGAVARLRKRSANTWVFSGDTAA